MALQTFAEIREQRIKEVIQHYTNQGIANDKNFNKFIEHFFCNLNPKINLKNTIDLYSIIYEQWQHLRQAKNNRNRVKITNIALKEKTVIQICSKEMPFVNDSVKMLLAREDHNILMFVGMLGIEVKKNNKDEITDINFSSARDNQGSTLSIYIEIEYIKNESDISKLTQKIEEVLDNISVVVGDRYDMKKVLDDTIDYLAKASGNAVDVDFLTWLGDKNFTFLACQEYNFQKSIGGFTLIPNTNHGLIGQLPSNIIVNSWPKRAQDKLDNNQIIIGKTNIKSVIHRAAHTDFIYIKKTDANGKLTGMIAFAGLYTASAYNCSPLEIPFLQLKVENILSLLNSQDQDLNRSAYLNILSNIPRDDLLNGDDEEIAEIIQGIFYLQERQEISLFVTKDLYDKYYSFLVYIPREKFNSQIRIKIHNIIRQELNSDNIEFDIQFSESTLVRIHFVVRFEDNVPTYVENLEELEKKLTNSTIIWEDRLIELLGDKSRVKNSKELTQKYTSAFPAAYREKFSPETGIYDIKYIESVQTDISSIAMYLYYGDDKTDINLKLFQLNDPFPLYDIVPMLENLNFRIIIEAPCEIILSNDTSVWINDCKVLYSGNNQVKIDEIEDIFKEAFKAIWFRKAENDGFNKLVLSAKVDWRKISMLRAYSRYLWQTNIPYSQEFIIEALYNNSEITHILVQLFDTLFNPEITANKPEPNDLIASIESMLKQVRSLSEDRIIRLYLTAIMATMRTNFYQKDKHGDYKDYISFKFASTKIPHLPLPVPLYEIFVYSVNVEGIHLRAAKVARGGLRWSDRKEDFRTEVLGLMKAQQVKNSVIVPMGAKGGFVVKNQSTLTPDEFKQEGINCYKKFIKGLLDITDNRIEDDIVHPKDVVVRDDTDPYLVVAADKGTASFSDIANSIAIEYNFWLGDAFASGGSAGYDHKKMGITAKGAFESVRLHFKRLNHDVYTTPFTVVGIGDMGGDVFGNGMLLSKQIKLIAAFNHKHIFFDPDPDPASSYAERQRLFTADNPAWDKYSTKLISTGGGVFNRDAKSINLSAPMQNMLATSAASMTPNELIKAILAMEVDLLWNGGIGTFIKSSKESHMAAGDKTNDLIRLDANQLKVKVVGEGGNLGLTQLARIEYSRLGGVINTDAIDNSAGVNCSDIEVNTKVLLNNVHHAGELSLEERDELLIAMTEEVTELVLLNNILQNHSISFICKQAFRDLQLHSHLLKILEKDVNLNRKVEFLPSEEEINNRKLSNEGLTRPEISVVIAYCKIYLKTQLLESAITEDNYVSKRLELSFPVQLRSKYKKYMETHRLRREIINTQISNLVVNEMGITFITRLREETGCLPYEIVMCFLAAREIFKAPKYRQAIFDLPANIPDDLENKMIQELNRLVRRATRWFLRNRRSSIDIEAIINEFKPGIETIYDNLANLLKTTSLGYLHKFSDEMKSFNIDTSLAHNLASMVSMYSSLDIVAAANENKLNILEVARVYYAVGAKLELSWLREEIKKHAICNNWESLARASFRDDIDKLQRELTINIFDTGLFSQDLDMTVNSWYEKNSVILERWDVIINDLKTIAEPGFTMFAILIRELNEITVTLTNTNNDK